MTSQQGGFVNISSIVIVTLATGALGAQEAPALDGRIQIFAEMYRPAQITVATPPGSSAVKDQPNRQTGVGFRFMGELASAPNWYYELGGMFDASSYFTYTGSPATGTTLDLTDVKVTDSYWSLGAAYMAKFGEHMTLGGHLEGRGEYLRIQGTAVGNTIGTQQQDLSTTYLRPWVRASFDYTFSSIGTNQHPFIGVDGSFALLRTSQTVTPVFSNFDNRNLKALAPRAAGAIYAGLRF
jgi:hypothetical protein